MLTKIVDGQPLLPKDKVMIESTFLEHEFVDCEYSESIRLYFRTLDVDMFNTNSTKRAEMVEYVGTEYYLSQRSFEQLATYTN